MPFIERIKSFSDNPLLPNGSNYKQFETTISFYQEQLDKLIPHSKQEFIAIQCNPYQVEVIGLLLAAWALKWSTLLLPDTMPEQARSSLLATNPIGHLITFNSKGELQILEAKKKNASPKGHFHFVQTSGSSGTPKLIGFSPDTLFQAALKQSDFLGIADHHIYPLTLPLNHVAGLMTLLRLLYRGASWSIIAKGHGLNQLASVDFLSLVPTQLFYYLKKPSLISLLAKCQKILIGGANCDQSLLAQAQENQWPLILTYGMTETLGFTAARPIKELSRGDLTTYSPTPWCQFSLAEDQRILIDSLIHHDCIYHNGQFTLTPKTFIIRTNDRGQWTNDFLHVEGRLDQIIISGGENIALASIKKVLLTHPLIEEVLLFTRSNERWGEEICALIISDELNATHMAQLKTFLKGHLEAFAIPRVWSFLTADQYSSPPMGIKWRLQDLLLHTEEGPYET